jgi:hypothetical protein
LISKSPLPVEEVKAPKKPVNGRSKGSAFERRIAKLFTEKFGVEFKRTPMSGGWTPVGDITPKDPTVAGCLPWVIECKCRQGWKLESVFTKAAEKSFLDWFAQAERDVKKSGIDKKPMVVFSKNLYPSLAMMKVADFEASFDGEFGEDSTVLFWRAADRGFFILLPFEELLHRYIPGSHPVFESHLPSA